MAMWKARDKLSSEVSKIWIIVVYLNEFSAWLVLGVKSWGAEAIAKFVFMQIFLTWMKRKKCVWMYLYITYVDYYCMIQLEF